VLVGIIGQVIVNSLGFHPSAKLVAAMAGAFPSELGKANDEMLSKHNRNAADKTTWLSKYAIF
jgi:hypothetical protein